MFLSNAFLQLGYNLLILSNSSFSLFFDLIPLLLCNIDSVDKFLYLLVVDCFDCLWDDLSVDNILHFEEISIPLKLIGSHLIYFFLDVLALSLDLFILFFSLLQILNAAAVLKQFH